HRSKADVWGVRIIGTSDFLRRNPHKSLWLRQRARANRLIGTRSSATRANSKICLRDRLDDQLRDMDVRRLGGDEEDRGGDVLGLEDAAAMLVGDRLGAKFEDGRVDFTGVDVGDANATVLLFRADA